MQSRINAQRCYDPENIGIISRYLDFPSGNCRGLRRICLLVSRFVEIFGRFTIKWDPRVVKNPPVTLRRKLLNVGGEINRAARKTASEGERNREREGERKRERADG